MANWLYVRRLHLPGIRKWPKEYLPSIFEEQRVDQVMDISQGEAEETMRSLARVEGQGLNVQIKIKTLFFMIIALFIFSIAAINTPFCNLEVMFN
jgi:hypothetical protein